VVTNHSDDGDPIMENSKKIRLELLDSFKVLENGQVVGDWSFVYDQSLLIKYKSAVLTAPFKYYKRYGNPEAESNCSKTFLGWHIPNHYLPSSNWSCFYGKKHTNEAMENKDHVGFLQIGTTLKEKKNTIGNILDNLSSELKKNKRKENDFSFSFMQMSAANQNRNLFEKQIKYEQMGKVVDKINQLNLGWEADIHPKYFGMSLAQVKMEMGLDKGNYKNTKSDKFSFIQLEEKSSINKEKAEAYLANLEKEISEMYKPKSTIFSQLNINEKSFAKSKSKLKTKSTLSNKNKESNEDKTCDQCVPHIYQDQNNPNKVRKIPSDSERETDSNKVTSYAEVTKYLDTEIKDIDETKLPRNWDWRNVGGVSYLPPVRNQGNCGSCYVFSTMTSLESRLRIKTNNKDKTLFSKQFALSCNFYSEGCDGGYPILVAKFSKEFELVPEDCFEYTEKTNSCKNACDYKANPKKYSVSKYGYLGGAYGKTSEADMMKEIRARGPMPGNIVVHWSFQYYKGGIFSRRPLLQNSDKINLKTLFDYGVSWAKVEHSITLVGYGEENGIKYWIGMNTWGKDWGERGFFRILRGENEAEVESMGDYFDVQVEDRH
jgi:C1A family cysteine protease